jgi:hypothetical protein
VHTVPAATQATGGAVPAPWGTVPMPTVSHFAGMDVPTDPIRWAEAQRRANDGKLCRTMSWNDVVLI